MVIGDSSGLSGTTRIGGTKDVAFLFVVAWRLRNETREIYCDKEGVS